MKLYLSAFLLLALTACSSGPKLDTSHPSVNFDNRVQYVVMHYTSASMERSLQLLTHGEVSSHYLIGDDSQATIYKLVDENARAWHAGESEWEGRTWLNSSSIGIEIVNPGFKDTPTGRLWYPYTEAQIQSITVLLKDIVKRNRIDPKHVIGHSDIAPLRKQDPGPLFPWKRLAAEGLGTGPTSDWLPSARQCWQPTCRASAGSSNNSHAWAIAPHKPESSTPPHARSSQPSRCTTGLHGLTANLTHRARPFYRCLIICSDWALHNATSTSKNSAWRRFDRYNFSTQDKHYCDGLAGLNLRTTFCTTVLCPSCMLEDALGA